MDTKRHKRFIPHYPAKRLEALADGVFAIVMTLMVLELAIPFISENSTNQEITRALFSIWPKILTYFLSFMILGVFWLIHHFIFENVKVYDTTLAWINIIFLMFVSLIPFTTSFLGEYFLETTPTLIYGLQLFLMFFLGFSLFAYSTAKNRLVEADFDAEIAKGGKVMGYIYFVILVIAIVFSFIKPVVSVSIYGLIVVLFIAFSGFGRAEYVITATSFGKKQNKGE